MATWWRCSRRKAAATSRNRGLRWPTGTLIHAAETAAGAGRRDDGTVGAVVLRNGVDAAAFPDARGDDADVVVKVGELGVEAGST